MFSYVSVEDRVPPDHPIRKLRVQVDAILRARRCRRYAIPRAAARRYRPRASLLQVVYSVRSERLLMEQLNYSLLDDSTYCQDGLFLQNETRPCHR
ncbi:hypothetical protein [Dyella sp. A6]|uniref:hypothetical protein n=1 Tax=Dyella aluminiiresistens TaxID=3069105 RepID=UPI002E766BC4|nr:hypothetical protein [Dyella sp. A6]